MIRQAYVPTLLDLHIDEKIRPGLAFVVDTSHPQFVDELSDERIASILTRSRGRGGPNRDYFLECLDHLEEMGVCTKRYQHIKRRLQQQRAAG
jgi:cation transport protein ChaC